MSQVIRISAVSYLNSIPFVYGIKNSGILENYSMELDVPSTCAEKLLKERVDIGLVPVALIPSLKEYHIISEYCIGAVGKVRTVLLLSNIPLNEIKTIYLDNDSLTSVNLLRVLLRDYWKIKPELRKISSPAELSQEHPALLIGDKTFPAESKYKYVYDLAECWINYTGLPFVFAAWISNKKLPESFISQFNQALLYGLNNIEDTVKTMNNIIPNDIAIDYLKNYISYPLTKGKKEGMNLFLQKLRTF
ncbi:MAG: menaquinone biosynthesis protein [Bacteroidota bacterium]|nr:menaquinone biosynthesis protein [Bacteroidota bacterium]